MSEKTKQARELLEKLPKAKLGFFPTPFHKLENLSKELGVNLWIKRDDMTGASLFGGNKVRKLEYLIGDAQAKQCEYVFTFGATQSNHAMQTAWACRKCGLKPILYLVAVVKPDEQDTRSNLLLDRILGAEVHIVEIGEGETEAQAEDRSVVMAREHMARLEAEGHRCYEVPMGGASEVGSVGFIDGFVELTEQLEAAGMEADYIFHATGTGGTLAGMQAGRKVLGSKTEIISIQVSAKDAGYPGRTGDLANQSVMVMEAAAAELLAKATALNLLTRVDGDQDIHTDGNYYLPGYEIPNEGSSEAIRLLARTEGLFVDPVYTGKAFAGMLDHIRTGKVPQGSTVVFWHTGGATALFAEQEILGDLIAK